VRAPRPLRHEAALELDVFAHVEPLAPDRAPAERSDQLVDQPPARSIGRQAAGADVDLWISSRVGWRPVGTVAPVIVAVKVEHDEAPDRIALIVAQLFQHRVKGVVLRQGTRNDVVRQGLSPTIEPEGFRRASVDAKLARAVEIRLKPRVEGDYSGVGDRGPLSGVGILLAPARRLAQRDQRFDFRPQRMAVVNGGANQRTLAA
jgi:hypothetical protein